jgi:hypothetical protein
MVIMKIRTLWEWSVDGRDREEERGGEEEGGKSRGDIQAIGEEDA